MFKEEYQKLNEQIAPSAELMEQTKRSMKVMMKKQEKRHMSGKRTVALVLACMLALTGVAFASGAVQSIFLWITEQTSDDNVNYDKLNELANQDLGNISQEAEGFGKASIEVKQAYYDGYQLIVGVEYDAESQVVMGLENEYVDLTRPESNSFCATKYEGGSNLPVPVRTLDEVLPETNLLPMHVAKHMTQAQIDEFEREYAEKGEAAVVIYRATASDQMDIVEDKSGRVFPAQDIRGQGETVNSVRRYIDFGELPADCINRDELTVKFGIRQDVVVCRADSEGIWVATVPHEKLVLSCKVERNDEKTLFCYGSFENEVYSAKAELRVSDVSSRLVLDVVRPQDWKAADANVVSIEEVDVDYIWCYHVMYADGSHEAVMESSWYVDENTYRTEGTVNLKGQNEIILRPYYTMSGLHEGEDIVLHIGQ